ncbi:hypothetical protein ACFL4W_04520 [Planctomycetota bacterium]
MTATARLSAILSDLQNGTAVALSPADLAINDAHLIIPAALTAFLKSILDNPLTVPDLGIVLEPRCVLDGPPDGTPAAAGNILIDGHFLLIGAETGGAHYFLALDLERDNYPVQTIDFDPLPPDADHPLEPAVLLEPVAPSLDVFLKGLLAVEEHYTRPDCITPPRSRAEQELKDQLEDILDCPINNSWWVTRLSRHKQDYFWEQFRGKQEKQSYQELVVDSIDANEALFGLFSIRGFKVMKSIKFFEVVEDADSIPVLLDLLSIEKRQDTAHALAEAIRNCRREAVPYLQYAAIKYPTRAGRLRALELLAEMNFTLATTVLLKYLEKGDPVEQQFTAALLADHEHWLTAPGPETEKARAAIAARQIVIDQLKETDPPDDNPDEPTLIYPLEWPPLDEADLAGVKQMGFLIIALAAFVGAGLFYAVTRKILSMAFGAAAVCVAAIFLPDLGSHFLNRKLKAAGYDQRVIDRGRIKTEIEKGNVIRCIEYARDAATPPLGYLFYLKSDLNQGENRPLIHFCKVEELEETVLEWYQQGLIPDDGPRSEAVRAFWRKMPKS